MEVTFTPIDLRSWSRGEVFYYFSQMAPTGYSLTAELDITQMHRLLKSEKRKFFPAYLWLVTRMLNAQMEFKMAEVDGKLGYYNVLTPLYAAFHEDSHTFSLMWTSYDDSFAAFYESYQADQAQYGKCHRLLAKEGQLPPLNAYTVSCVPWIPFQHFAVHSYERKAYYFPSVEAGKFYWRGEKLVMPLSITCHHAATDGWHISRFLKDLQEEADRFEVHL